VQIELVWWFDAAVVALIRDDDLTFIKIPAVVAA